MVEPAWKHIVGSCTSTSLEPCSKATASVSRDLELHWPTGFLLDHHRAVSDFRPGQEITYLQLHQITAAELAVDCEVEQCPIPQSLFAIKEETDRLNLLLGQGPLCADRLTGIPYRTVLLGWVKV